MIKFGNDWDHILKEEFEKEYYTDLRRFLKLEYRSHTVYPDMYDIFNALKMTAYSDVNVLILGQDPYHGPSQANGLSFSVQNGVAIPPSLVNIFKEISDEFGTPTPKHGNLTKWAEQGVLLMNTVLTVRAGIPNSHKGKGWEIFTDNIIKVLNERDRPLVFMLWGNNAKAKDRLINNKNHLVLKSTHPSPLSAYNGFFGCGHFKKANSFLANQNRAHIIDWTVD